MSSGEDANSAPLEGVFTQQSSKALDEEGESEQEQGDAALQDSSRSSIGDDDNKNFDEEDELSKPTTVEVRLPTSFDRSVYESFSVKIKVAKIVKQAKDVKGQPWYNVAYEDGSEEEIALAKLLKLPNGIRALEIFDSSSDRHTRRKGRSGRPSGRASMSSNLGKRTRGRPQVADSESDERGSVSGGKKLRLTTAAAPGGRRSARNSAQVSNLVSSESDSDNEDPLAMDDAELESSHRGLRESRGRSTRASRATAHQQLSYADKNSIDDEDDESITVANEESDNSDIVYIKPKTKTRKVKPPTRGKKARNRGRSTHEDLDDSGSERPGPSRRSGRSNKASASMRERLEDDEQFAEESAATPKGPVVVSVREIFQELPAANKFRSSHNQQCDVCSGLGKSSSKGISPLIYCQGCTTSIHRACLGPRSQREHIVTKIGDQNFVLQCRRCVGVAKKKDKSAPSLDMCQGCKELSAVCEPFSQKRTPKQEEQLRAENSGIDPIIEIKPSLINNYEELLFRCSGCFRGFHFEHLPVDEDEGEKEYESLEHRRKALFREYSKDFNCEQCRNSPAKIQTIVAWRPIDASKFDPQKHNFDSFTEDDKEYLIKWDQASYFRCQWMPGPWVWGVTVTAMRNAFIRRDEGANKRPKMTTDDAIPEEFVRMEIVLDVTFDGRVTVRSEAVDKARIYEVDQVLVKFQGLSYTEAVWENPPSHDSDDPYEQERWKAFESAYNEWVAGRYFKPPAPRMKERIEDFRSQDFKKLELHKQPASLTGGTMKDYQLEGLNYMLYKYHQQDNCILADEMGLGKTIQVIATIAALIKDKPKVWPFLVVVPNSTCPNWRREIKTWAPSLRVVAYYGLRDARDMAMKYELYPDGSSDLRAHIVVTSFDAPTDDHSRAFFKKVKWAGLFVDEGQRLKNEKNQLYSALTELRVPFRVLLTGTPLQNNKRELFNLLHFIDNSLNAVQLDEKYAELTDDNLTELHDLIRPYFLRRTKVQVLRDLPPMAQVIIPVTMSTLQKRLYKSILGRNPELIQSLYVKDKEKLKFSERGSLNNILMQLRKVLCHPFIYSDAVEERYTGNDEEAYRRTQRSLIDAASKLQLLDLLLPKLKERGHRVLIFTQFLDQLNILEDFLIGLGLEYRRLDGTIGTIEKQKRIDEFNQPDSTLFAFLLSTRAGGVGINLATADTVIIMDPDFNPHQDMQALSRAHRIGQKNKVLVFNLMTKNSAEEKIVQIGRKKMALDHVLIESIDNDDDAGIDLTSILAHGAKAIFDGDDSGDIHYDGAAIDKLLDRTQIENTKSDEDGSGENQFSYARVWANDEDALVEGLDDDSAEPITGVLPDFWDKILQERAEQAAREAALKQKAFGRGKRVRSTVNYNSKGDAVEDDDGQSPQKFRSKKARPAYPSDTDFGGVAESDGDEDEEPEPTDIDIRELQNGVNKKDPSKAAPFERAIIPLATIPPNLPNTFGITIQPPPGYHQPKYCYACRGEHPTGYCPLKLAGVEHCGLCGLAHFGNPDICPNLNSETQVRLMLDTLRFSTDSRDIVDRARAILRTRIGNIVRNKKERRASQNPRSQTSRDPSVSSLARAPVLHPRYDSGNVINQVLDIRR